MQLHILELADILIERPSQYARRVEEISTVFKNLHHLLNSLRPHQVCNLLYRYIYILAFNLHASVLFLFSGIFIMSCTCSVGESNIDSHSGTSDRAPQTSCGGHKEVCNAFPGIFLNCVGTLRNLLLWCQHSEMSLCYDLELVAFNNFVGLTFFSYILYWSVKRLVIRLSEVWTLDLAHVM